MVEWIELKKTAYGVGEHMMGAGEVWALSDHCFCSWLFEESLAINKLGQLSFILSLKVRQSVRQCVLLSTSRVCNDKRVMCSMVDRLCHVFMISYHSVLCRCLSTAFLSIIHFFTACIDLFTPYVILYMPIHKALRIWGLFFKW